MTNSRQRFDIFEEILQSFTSSENNPEFREELEKFFYSTTKTNSSKKLRMDPVAPYFIVFGNGILSPSFKTLKEITNYLVTTVYLSNDSDISESINNKMVFDSNIELSTLGDKIYIENNHFVAGPIIHSSRFKDLTFIYCCQRLHRFFFSMDTQMDINKRINNIKMMAWQCLDHMEHSDFSLIVIEAVIMLLWLAAHCDGFNTAKCPIAVIQQTSSTTVQTYKEVNNLISTCYKGQWKETTTIEFKSIMDMNKIYNRWVEENIERVRRGEHNIKDL